MTGALEPVDIGLSSSGGALEIEWSDGHTTRTDLRALRWNCPCAECSGEMGYQGRLSRVSELPEEDYVLEGVQPVGRYGLRPVWRSGHDSGIYTYELLRYLCECPEHTRAREAAEGR